MYKYLRKVISNNNRRDTDRCAPTRGGPPHPGFDEEIKMQKAWKFDKETAKKTARGALIAGGGVAVVYVLEAVAKMDFGSYTPLVAAGCSIIINAVREYVQGEK